MGRKRVSNVAFFIIISFLVMIIDFGYKPVYAMFAEKRKEYENDIIEKNLTLHAKSYVKSLNNKLYYEGYRDNKYYISDLNKITIDSNENVSTSWVKIKSQKIVEGEFTIDKYLDKYYVYYDGTKYELYMGSMSKIEEE